MIKLTPRQRAAVESTECDILVVAGAGAGKTGVIVERILWLLNHGSSPSDIMCLTFTRKAAGELTERLETSAIEGGQDRGFLSGMLLGTFHSVALRILRDDGDKLGYDTKTLTILDEADSRILLEQICRDLGFFDGKTWRQGVTWTKLRRYLDRVYSGAQQANEWPYGEIVKRYHDRIHELNALDFGRILSECERLFVEHPSVLERLRARIKHVLVDELQDSDERQYNMHWHIVEPGKTCFFGVGDTRQTIYQWRGARPDLMHERHPDALVINLRDCFRCGETIVESANALIAHNQELHAEPMVENPIGKSALVEVKHGRSADIAAHVQRVHREGYAWSDIAVLTRANLAAKCLEDVFGEAEIPCYRVGSGFDVCDTDEFRLLHAALRLCVNPRDDLAFLRLVPALGLSLAEYAAVRERAAENGCGHYSAYRTRWIKGKEPPDENDLRTLIDGYSVAGAPLGLHVRALAGALPTVPYDAAEFWAEHCDGMDIASALRWFALRDSQDDMPEGEHVTISTIHSAKGLEWPCVFVVGLNDGELPSAMSRKEGPEGLRDERRVCYVAFTRAAERLVLFYREIQDQSPKRKLRPVSPFLEEARLLHV